MSDTRIPYALRTLKNEYLSVAKVIENDYYLDMTKNQFIGEVMKESGGSLSPQRVSMIYHDLMKDAGLEPL